MIKRVLLSVAIALLVAPAAFADFVIDKPPDLGPFWLPLDAETGTYIYADSFVAAETSTVNELGTWLLSLDGDGAGPSITFEVFGSIAGNPALGPDSTNVIASTGLIDISGGTTSLDFYSASTTFSGTLQAGTTYWFAASVIGGTGAGGSYQTGGHTQNSVYNDNGTFWFSNDPTGVFFDGQGFTPEMAFRVSAKTIPEPTSLGVLTIGLISLVRLRQRRR